MTVDPGWLFMEPTIDPVGRGGVVVWRSRLGQAWIAGTLL